MSTAVTTSFRVVALDPVRLDDLRTRRIDHAGSPFAPFVDADGGWPLRCCLRDSRPGERLTLVAWRPFTWVGPYAETGPVAVHAERCEGYAGAGVPPQFESRRQIVRPYRADHRIAYEHIRLVEEHDSLAGALDDVFANPGVECALVRNVLAGCLSFAVVRDVGECTA